MPTKNAYSVAKDIHSGEDLAKALSDHMKHEGLSEKQYDYEQSVGESLRKQAALGLTTKANEVMNTGATGYGAELVPGSVLSTDFLDLVPQYSPLLAVMRGYHGRNLNKTHKVPVVGRLPEHAVGSEWSTGAGSSLLLKQGNNRQPTDAVTIEQRKYDFTIDYSIELERFGVVDIKSIIERKMAQSASETFEGAIIRADSTDTATGNINRDDADPDSLVSSLGYTPYWYGGDNGLIKQCYTDTSTYDIGATISLSDFVNIMAKLGAYANPLDCVWVFESTTYLKALTISEFVDASTNGQSSTATTGAITNILGSDVFISRYLTKSDADGKYTSTSPATNNTKGTALYFHRDAVQYGYNGQYSLELVRVPAQGYQIVGHYFAGFALAGKKALETDPMYAYGYNATLF